MISTLKSFHSIIGFKTQNDIYFNNHSSALNVEPSQILDVDLSPGIGAVVFCNFRLARFRMILEVVANQMNVMGD